MNNYLVAFIISAGITGCIMFFSPKSEQASQQNQGIKTFIISYIVTFLGVSYLVDKPETQFIETGDAPF